MPGPDPPLHPGHGRALELAAPGRRLGPRTSRAGRRRLPAVRRPRQHELVEAAGRPRRAADRDAAAADPAVPGRGRHRGSDDPLSLTFTPLKLLAANLSIAIAGVAAVLLMARLATVPWRSLISSRRAFDARRLAQYLLGAALLVGAGIGVVALVAPESPCWVAFGISGTAILMLVVTVLSTPLHAVGEELMYRSAALPAAASWVRAVRPALAVCLVISSLAFAVVHGSSDPWLFGYYTFVGVATGLMAIISRGIEAPVAFHIADNVLFSSVNTLMAGGGAYAIDRSTDTGDAAKPGAGGAAGRRSRSQCAL